MTSIPRTVRQVAVTVGSTSGSVTQVQGGATTATSAGALVLRQMMTPQLATSQVSVSSTSRASAFLLDNSSYPMLFVVVMVVVMVVSSEKTPS